VSELDDVQTTVAVIDGLRSRIAELEAENKRLNVRRCETCKHWQRHSYDGDGTCLATITYKPDWMEEEDEPLTVEFIALYASNNEYSFRPPADFACNRWTARAEEGSG
jgi:hypothetical protein